jgi:hypothetical protein
MISFTYDTPHGIALDQSGWLHRAMTAPSGRAAVAATGLSKMLFAAVQQH